MYSFFKNKSKLASKQLSITILLVTAAHIAYSQTVTDPIAEFITGTDNVYVRFNGDELSPSSGHAISVVGSITSSGSAYIGYNDDGSAHSISGQINPPAADYGIYYYNQGAGNVFVQSAASMDTTLSAMDLYGSGNIDVLINSGVIRTSSADSIYASAGGNGNIRIENIRGLIYAENDNNSSGSTMELFSQGGNIDVVNNGALYANKNGIYAESGNGGAISIFNTGTLESTGTYGIYVNTSSTINVHNAGAITVDPVLGGANGIYVGSNVTGGTVVNSGFISEPNGGDSVYIAGHNVTFSIEGEVAHIEGRITLEGGKGNVFSIGSYARNVTGGGLFISNSTYQLQIIDINQYGSTNIASGSYSDINNAILSLDLSKAIVNEGDIFVILDTLDYQYGGHFFGLDDQEELSLTDSYGEYQFKIHYEIGRVYLEALNTVIPEPSSYTLFACIVTFGLVAIRRRQRFL